MSLTGETDSHTQTYVYTCLTNRVSGCFACVVPTPIEVVLGDPRTKRSTSGLGWDPMNWMEFSLRILPVHRGLKKGGRTGLRREPGGDVGSKDQGTSLVGWTAFRRREAILHLITDTTHNR